MGKRPIKIRTAKDAAAYYAPYIPLVMTAQGKNKMNGNYSMARASTRPAKALKRSPAIRYNEKEKKMGWFRRKFMEWSRQAWEDSNNDMCETTLVSESIQNLESKNYIQIKVHNASGGYIIEHRSYDYSKDSYCPPDLTVVHRDADIAEKIRDIIVMEGLKA